MLRLATILAWFWVVAGIISGGLGLYVAYVLGVSEYPRYLGNMTTGESIDRGLIYITVGAALGVLCLIAKNTRQKA